MIGSPQQDIASFVLRFRQHARPNAQGEVCVEWRGKIHHIQQDAEICFTDLDKAVHFIQETLAKLSQEDPNIPISGQVSGAYTVDGDEVPVSFPTRDL